MSEKMRINKYLAAAGVCSRRGADELISQGRVLVNGEVPGAGDSVSDLDKIEIDGEVLRVSDEDRRTVVLAYNKPVGIVCSTVDQGRDNNNIVDAVGYHRRVYPIGRLDKDSEGLILMTNDGALAEEVMKAGNGHEKEYIVTLDRPFDEVFIKKMSEGVLIEFEDKSTYRTKPCSVRRVDGNIFSIILTEGKNRQIRRMCRALGYSVERLRRVRIMQIMLGDIPCGKFRELTVAEIAAIRGHK